MNLFFLFLTLTSGLLSFKSPLFLLLLIFPLIRFKKEKKMLIASLIIFAVALGYLFLKVYLAKLPFKEGVGLVTKSSENSFIIHVFGRSLYVPLKNNPYHVGDVMRIRDAASSPVKFLSLEGEFSYQDYLLNKGVYLSVSTNNIDLVIRSPLRLIAKLSSKIAQYPVHLEGLRRLLLTNSIDYQNSFLMDLQRNDLLYLISLTGAHLSFLRRLSYKVLKKFIDDKKAEIVSIIFLIPLYLLQITKFVFYRIVFSYIFKLLNKRALKSYFSKLEINVLLAAFFLILNPFLMFDASFYLAFLLILMFNLAPFVKGIRGKIRSLILILLVIVPYKIIVSGRINPVSFLISFLTVPVVGLWFVTYFLTLFIPILNNIPMTILNLLYSIIKFVDSSSLTLYFASPNSVVNGLIIGVAFLSFYALLSRNKLMQKQITFFAFSALLISFLPLKNLFTIAVTFINIGQGDSILIEVKGKNILLDTGGLRNKDVGQDILIHYFYKKNIYKLDYLIISHNDFDHNGAQDTLTSKFTVKNLITERSAFPFSVNGITFNNLNNDYYSDDNLNSLIVYAHLPSFSLLLMGDAGIVNEKALIKNYPNLKVDVLKVGHHGSNTSTSEEFIAHYRPQKAVISVGANNFYGHPHQSVLKTLNKYNVEIYRTDLSGSICLKSSII